MKPTACPIPTCTRSREWHRALVLSAVARECTLAEECPYLDACREAVAGAAVQESPTEK